jgi:ankyrin repeat protein
MNSFSARASGHRALGKEIIVNKSFPARVMREHPDLEQLKRQAKELLDAFLAGEPEAVAEVNAHYRNANSGKFALHDAQLVLARAYGFESWPRLKAYVEGVHAKRLVEAVQADDIAQVRAMLKARPELANTCSDNYQVLHYAVFNRSTEVVRLLMQHGASARHGVYPHGDATTPLTIADERGYHEIAAIIRQEEQRRKETKGTPPARDEFLTAIRSGDYDRAIAWIDADPALVNRKIYGEWTALDAAATRPGYARKGTREKFAPLAAALLQRGASMTARAAVALGDAGWIRARHAEGALPGPADPVGGLLNIAVIHERPEMLALLLDLGFDPDERVRLGVDEVAGGKEHEPEYTWGFPLWECAATGKYELAEMLLKRGADPNAMVYASGTPVDQAYGQRDQRMIDLLERYGGRAADAGLAAIHRMTELAKRKFEEAEDRQKAAQDLVFAGACGGDLELVRFALPMVDLPRDDPKWFGALEGALRLWNHGSGHWCHPEWDRSTYLECFRLILRRCDPNLRGRETDKGQSGFTILHIVTGGRVAHMTGAEQVEFATALLDAGARLDIRDHLLKSTPLGWACRWGRVELVKLFLARGADPIEADAEPWATPLAWAEKLKHADVLALLREYRPKTTPE